MTSTVMDIRYMMMDILMDSKWHYDPFCIIATLMEYSINYKLYLDVIEIVVRQKMQYDNKNLTWWYIQ